MNDDDLSELILRASAYLDGELDAAEMARAEADPAVMAEVAALRELQDSVREVEPAADTVRESAIAAALAEFDALNAAHVPVPPADDEPLHIHLPHAPVVPFRPRPAYARWLTAAAAVVAVGLLGVVVANGVGGGDDEEAAVSPQIDSAATIASSSRTAEAEGGVAQESATAEESAEAADSAVAEIAAAPEAAPATTAAAADAAEESGDVFTATATAAPAFPSFDPERPITSVGELAAVGAELLAGELAGTVVRDVETLCDPSPFAPYKRGLYDDLTGSGPREVIIAIDVAAGQTGAFDADSCTLVAVTPLP